MIFKKSLNNKTRLLETNSSNQLIDLELETIDETTVIKGVLNNFNINHIEKGLKGIYIINQKKK